LPEDPEQEEVDEVEVEGERAEHPDRYPIDAKLSAKTIASWRTTTPGVWVM
jgi:hypothetical protein